MHRVSAPYYYHYHRYYLVELLVETEHLELDVVLSFHY